MQAMHAVLQELDGGVRTQGIARKGIDALSQTDQPAGFCITGRLLGRYTQAVEHCQVERRPARKPSLQGLD